MYREKIYGVAIKIETTPLTDSVPGVTDAIRIVGGPAYLKWDFLEPGKRDDVVTGQLGAAARAIPAGRFGTIELQMEAKGAGAAYSASVLPEIDPIARIAGMSRTLTVTSGTESCLYFTNDTSTTTATTYCWAGGKLFKLVGCVATLKFSTDATKRGFFTATVSGVMTSDPTETSLAALTYQSALPPLFHSAVATIGSWSSGDADPLSLESVMVDLGNAVVDIASAGAVDGHAGYLVADRLARQEMSIKLPALATFDVFAAAKLTGSALPLTTWQLGTVQYNRIKGQTGKWQLEVPAMGSNKSLVNAKLAGNLLIGSAPTSSREINFLFD